MPTNINTNTYDDDIVYISYFNTFTVFKKKKKINRKITERS